MTAVISLVASIVNAQMGEARQKADDAHMKTEVQQVRNAVEQYRQKTGSVPLSPSGGSYKAGNMVTEDSTEYQEVMQQLVDEGYMPEVPSSPDGQSYSYLATTDGKQAVFAATLNNDDSGSNTNGCDVVEGITVTSCITDIDHCGGENMENTYDSSTNLLYCDNNEPNEPVDGYIDEICDFSNYWNNDCNGEVLNDDLPEDTCDYYYDPYYADDGSIDGCIRVAAGYIIMCDYTGEKSVCDGFDNSDYCSCI